METATGACWGDHRGELWAVDGIVLDPVVLSVLPDRVDDLTHLITSVVAAGFEWNVVTTNPL